MACLFLLQMFWSYGVAYTSDMRANFQAYERSTSTIIGIEQQVSELHRAKARIDGLRTQAANADSPLSEAERRALLADAARLDEQHPNLEAELETLAGRIAAEKQALGPVHPKIGAYYCIILTWSNANFATFPWTGGTTEDLIDDCVERTRQERAVLPASEDAARIAALETSVRSRLHAFSGFYLPALYGLLGTLAFILRSLLVSIRDVTFTKMTIFRFALRVPLGVLAGIAIGWFLTPDAGEAAEQSTASFFDIGSIGPFALAFLAGYSVEVVFTGMDRLVGAFTTER